MIPVTLRLRNFLSYGTAAEPLDFGSFSVACLSGKNGQGKSALLDAITWALWGEARKSSGVQKPDDELLRIGTRDMEVEFVFDLEGTRYRIRRTYHRSASGKTSKPGLEFQVYESATGEFRPLTAESIRATQALIQERVGIDYETFINSAFLLQGRSDEFTKKKPGERKDILGRILGIDRYERLAARAGQRFGQHREQVRRHQEAIERLRNRLEGESGWKQELGDIEAHIANLEQQRAERSAQDGQLQHRKAALDALEVQAESAKSTLKELNRRRQRLDDERTVLARKIEEAQHLVGQAEEIVAANEEYERLTKERNALDEKASLQRGFDHQVQQLTLQLERIRLDQDRALERLRAELESLKQRLDDDEQRLTTEMPGAREALQRSRTASVQVVTLRADFERREALRTRLVQLERQLDGERNRLIGTLTALRQRIASLASVHGLAALEQNLAAIVGRLEERDRLQEALEKTREEGTEVKAELGAQDHERTRIIQDIEALEARRQLLRTADVESCPTCGTALTEEHRQTVAATYKTQLEEMYQGKQSVDKKIHELDRRRTSLRTRFSELRDHISRLSDLDSERARLEEEVARRDRERQSLQHDRTEAARLETLIEEEAFHPELHAERTHVIEALQGFDFDEEAYDQLRLEAEALNERQRAVERLDVIAERRDGLIRRIAKGESELVALRDRIDAGEETLPIQNRVAELNKRRESLGYSGAQHDAIRRALEELESVPQRFLQLVQAQRNLDEWVQRQDGLDREWTLINGQVADETKRLEEMDRTLFERSALIAEIQTVRGQLDALEQNLSDAQGRRGGLQERLAQCATDRVAMATERALLNNEKQRAALYKHLRGAFGKHGIPSLIIEETLPEIQDRANLLLDRLSNGHTQVTLETLADKKAGGTKETLDIRITDEQGVARSYETFSGGEAFRVNFALRIALAQLLADRSGVRIRTLVIDEGFGTQDQEGIQNLVEAITTIQDDFSKILVITHLDELKNAFPIRIEVTKRAVEGSTYEVVGI